MSYSRAFLSPGSFSLSLSQTLFLWRLSYPSSCSCTLSHRGIKRQVVGQWYSLKFKGKQWLPGEFLCTTRWPPPLSRFWGVVQNSALDKAVHHGFEPRCSSMATQKLEEKVHQNNEDAESSKADWRGPSRAHGNSCEPGSELSCDSYTRRNLRTAPFVGGGVAHREPNPLPKKLGWKSEIARWNFIIPKKFMGMYLLALQ